MKSLLFIAGLLAVVLTSCSKIETFRFKDPNNPGDSSMLPPTEVSRTIKSITITRYDATNKFIDSSTRYFFYDSTFPVVAVSTTPITDTVQPFTGYIYLHEDQYGDLTRVFGRYKTNPDSIAYLKMTYTYGDLGMLTSATRIAVDGTETSFTVTPVNFENGMSYLSYPGDIPSASNATYGVTRFPDGYVSSVYSHTDQGEYFDTTMVNNETGVQSPILRNNYDGTGAYNFLNVTAVTQNADLRNLHRAVFLGVENLPGAFFTDGLSPDIAREFQPYMPVSTEVTLVQPDLSRKTTTFQHNPVIDENLRILSADLFSIVNNQICRQHWRVTYTDQ